MAITFAEREADKYPDLAPTYRKLATLYGSKLWHQATDVLLKFVRDPANSRGSNLEDLWNSYIKPAGRRFHPVKFAHLTAICAQPVFATDPARAEAMMGEVLSVKAAGEEHDQARLVAELEVAVMQLRLGDTAECKRVVEKHAAAVEDLEEADSLVPATFFRVASELYRTTGPPSAFHDASLRFLTHTPLEHIAAAGRPALAVDLAVSALLSDDVYSFAEVLEHPIAAHIGAGPVAATADTVESGAGGSSAASAAGSSSSSSSSAAADEAEIEVADPWLADLMRSADRGDVDGVASCLAAHRADMARHPALAAGAEELKAKTVLMAIMATAAARPASKRSLGFAELADACGLDTTDVEWVVMRASAKGLIQATIDGVDEVVHVHYVRPRALGRESVGRLAGAVRSWTARAHEQLLTVEFGARDIMS